MPEINFILPHWIYWGALLIVPLALFALARRDGVADGDGGRGDGRVAGGRSLIMAYFLLLVGGFVGLHRLYARSVLAGVFIALFAAVLYCNDQSRLARNEYSLARNEKANVEYDLQRAEEDGEARQVLDDYAARLEEQRAIFDAKGAALENWRARAEYIALALALLLAVDALLLPRLFARLRRKEEEGGAEAGAERGGAAPRRAAADGAGGGAMKRAAAGSDRFSRFVSAINGAAGEFVSYWTLIAVFAFYYEVIVRYVFNSPTIWVHEGMYLMFGMQYLIAGGFCLRENAHVRVDVLYLHLSPAARAAADLATSLFFFIFTAALMISGWIFFHDAWEIREVSFTEWAIPHYPIKFALPLGGALIVLQGAAQLLYNIEVLRQAKGPGGGGRRGGAGGAGNGSSHGV